MIDATDVETLASSEGVRSVMFCWSLAIGNSGQGRAFNVVREGVGSFAPTDCAGLL